MAKIARNAKFLTLQRECNNSHSQAAHEAVPEPESKPADEERCIFAKLASPLSPLPNIGR